MSRDTPQIPAESAAPPSAAQSGEVKIPPKPWRVRIIWGLATLIALVLIWVWYQGSHVTTDRPDATSLAGGPVSQIVPWINGRHNAVQFSRIFPGNADEFWKVVTDQGRFDEFMPFVEYTRVRPGPDGTRIEEQRLNLPFGDQNLELEIRMLDEPPSRIARWRQRKGSLRFNEGAWVVEKAGNDTILRYQVAASVDFIPQWIVNFAMRRRLGKLLQAVHKRVNSLKETEPQYFTRDTATQTTGSKS